MFLFKTKRRADTGLIAGSPGRDGDLIWDKPGSNAGSICRPRQPFPAWIVRACIGVDDAVEYQVWGGPLLRSSDP